MFYIVARHTFTISLASLLKEIRSKARDRNARSDQVTLKAIQHLLEVLYS
jgi:hypothetical protein